MKRIFVAFLGLVAGLALTWVCLYALSHSDRASRSAPSGCDVEHCGPSWLGPLILVACLLPSIGFSVAAYFAQARSWSIQRTASVFALLVVGTVLFVVRPYVWPGR
jgi:hypothetical protein